jgi:hypothetical protein
MLLSRSSVVGLAYVWPDALGILGLGVILFGISVRRFARPAR